MINTYSTVAGVLDCWLAGWLLAGASQSTVAPAAATLNGSRTSVCLAKAGQSTPAASAGVDGAGWHSSCWSHYLTATAQASPAPENWSSPLSFSILVCTYTCLRALTSLNLRYNWSCMILNSYTFMYTYIYLQMSVWICTFMYN